MKPFLPLKCEDSMGVVWTSVAFIADLYTMGFSPLEGGGRRRVRRPQITAIPHPFGSSCHPHPVHFVHSLPLKGEETRQIVEVRSVSLQESYA